MKKKIIFFARDMSIGGVETALVSLLNSTDHDRYDVTLVLEQASGALLGKLSDAVTVEEYSLSRCRFVPLRRAVNFIKRMLWAARRRGKYDFSCAYCTYSVIGSRLAQYASPNSCLYVHSDYTKSLPDAEAVSSFFNTLRAGRFRRLLFVSNESRSNFLGVFPALSERTEVINNLVDTEKIRRLAAEAVPVGLPEGKTVFLFVGRLEEESKRLTRLLDAFRIARERRGDIALVIVGGGKDMELCRSIIARYGLESDVLLAGSRDNPYCFMREADCIVLTSDYEGFPVVYYEAMTLGKPIITTVRVSDEYIDVADYALIAEKSAESVADAMCGFTGGRCGPTPDIDGINALRIEAMSRIYNERED